MQLHILVQYFGVLSSHIITKRKDEYFIVDIQTGAQYYTERPGISPLTIRSSFEIGGKTYALYHKWCHDNPRIVLNRYYNGYWSVVHTIDVSEFSHMHQGGQLYIIYQLGNVIYVPFGYGCLLIFRVDY